MAELKKLQTKRDDKIVKVCLRLLYHIVKKHKEMMPGFWLWFISRHLIDQEGRGWVDIGRLCKRTKRSLAYTKRVINHSSLFRGLAGNKAFYSSLSKQLFKHKLRYELIRSERRNSKFANLFTSLRLFKAYIIKCYLEQDFRKGKSRIYTKGRISYGSVADYFLMTRRSVINLIDLSDAIGYRNEATLVPRIRVHISHPDQFGNWLLNHMDLVIDGFKIADNLRSYFIRADKRGYYLCQLRPNIYKFTGVSLARKTRGQRP